jgi:hypothetical protein
MYGSGLSHLVRMILIRLIVASSLVVLVVGPALPSVAGQDGPIPTTAPNESALSGPEDPSSNVGGLGMVPSGPDKQHLVRMPGGLASVAELPSTVDLAPSSLLLEAQPSYEGIPPVGNQGQTNTCTAWATSYYYKSYQEWFERGWNLKNGGPEYDHIFSPGFVYNQITGGSDAECDDGAQIPAALNLIVNQGDLPWSGFPWNPIAPNCTLQPTPAQKSAAALYKGLSYWAFFISQGPPDGPQQNHNLSPLKQWLAGGDPFVLGFPVYSEFDNYVCNQAVPPPANAGTYRGLHAVAVVGYDDNWADVGAFRIVNSYGSQWGCYGYAWLSYEFVRKYAWEAWYMWDNWAPSIDPHVPDLVSPTLGSTLVVDLTPYENDREDSGTALKWYVEGADHCTVYGQESSNDVLQFAPNPSNYSGYDEITLILRDSRGAEDRQQMTLGWFDLDPVSYLPLAVKN